ncbi:unnamed protein product [Heterobilharzia americana]|nr:unnamed protein product [Heterobilharzia americana]
MHMYMHIHVNCLSYGLLHKDHLICCIKMLKGISPNDAVSTSQQAPPSPQNPPGFRQRRGSIFVTALAAEQHGAPGSSTDSPGSMIVRLGRSSTGGTIGGTSGSISSTNGLAGILSDSNALSGAPVEGVIVTPFAQYQKAENDSRPDIQYTIISASPFEKDTFESLGNFNPPAWHQFSKDENRANFENPIVLLVSLLNPLSRGEIKMKKNDNGSPNGKLEVNPAYLSEPNDVNRLVEGIIWIYKALNYVNAMNKLNLTISNTKKPISIKLHLPHYFGCPKIPKAESEKSFEQTNFSEELKEAIACLTKSTTLSNYHTVGTCAMKLQNTNYPAVVDQNFKLIGVNNVRIGDASVISKIPTGNPAALIMAIGNQLAKYVVRENWQQLIMTTNSK